MVAFLLFRSFDIWSNHHGIVVFCSTAILRNVELQSTNIHGGCSVSYRSSLSGLFLLVSFKSLSYVRSYCGFYVCCISMVLLQDRLIKLLWLFRLGFLILLMFQENDLSLKETLHL